LEADFSDLNMLRERSMAAERMCPFVYEELPAFIMNNNSYFTKKVETNTYNSGDQNNKDTQESTMTFEMPALPSVIVNHTNNLISSFGIGKKEDEPEKASNSSKKISSPKLPASPPPSLKQQKQQQPKMDILKNEVENTAATLRSIRLTQNNLNLNFSKNQNIKNNHSSTKKIMQHTTLDLNLNRKTNNKTINSGGSPSSISNYDNSPNEFTVLKVKSIENKVLLQSPVSIKKSKQQRHQETSPPVVANAYPSFQMISQSPNHNQNNNNFSLNSPNATPKRSLLKESTLSIQGAAQGAKQTSTPIRSSIRSRTSSFESLTHDKFRNKSCSTPVRSTQYYNQPQVKHARFSNSTPTHHSNTSSNNSNNNNNQNQSETNGPNSEDKVYEHFL
jgi:hypothetical protein